MYVSAVLARGGIDMSQTVHLGAVFAVVSFSQDSSAKGQK